MSDKLQFVVLPTQVDKLKFVGHADRIYLVAAQDAADNDAVTRSGFIELGDRTWTHI